VPVTGSTNGALDAAQARNAKIIIGVALSRGRGSSGAAIGVSVALAESTLFNNANDGTSTLVGSGRGPAAQRKAAGGGPGIVGVSA